MGSLGGNTEYKHINLQLGWPTPSLFPSQALADCAQHVLLDESIAAKALIYGPDPGDQALREATASWLGRVYQLQGDALPTSDRIFITNGASAGVNYLLTRFADPSYTRMIWMVEPTYFLACPIFEQAGYKGRLRGVPEDEHGIDLAYLKDALTRVDKESNTSYAAPGRVGRSFAQKIYRHIIYCVPTFSNPSARTMPVQLRKELVQLARKHDALIISDDVYDALAWPSEDIDHVSTSSSLTLPPRLVDVDRLLPGYQPWGNTVSNGSFSKIVAPGIRVGWLDGSVEMAQDLCKLGPVLSGGSQSHLSAMIVSQLLQSGKLDQHISDVLIPTYRRRYRVMIESITKHMLPLGATIDIPISKTDLEAGPAMAGGFFIYLNLPCGAETVQQVSRVAMEEYNLKVAAGNMMVVAGDAGSIKRAQTTFGRGVRLCWAWHEEDVIDEGIQRLAAAYSQVQGGLTSAR
ncbi:aminotransferase class I and II domain-containing protein [Sarocladium implicatum]|nr:aminotransferase class I and II domain-containing protein [Sarocladium implicatum]